MTQVDPTTIRDVNRILNAIQPPGIKVECIEFDGEGGFIIHLEPTKPTDDVGPSGIGGGTIKSFDGE